MRDALIEAAARALYAHVEGVDAEANKPHMDYWFGNPDPADKLLADEYRADATAVLNAILSLLENPSDEMGNPVVYETEGEAKEKAAGLTN